ncbi:CGNR zinc finger domain-containing protein [Salinarimonas rosea]|uniref:CGNR zinc finger domain-containing protein n=1 Tax=Salinarimonas rosea TaxID=552063 RepID=UPI000414579A|nr:CGNR zinc finger domain-containing protein [Salinarimonas rosea]
MTERSEVDQRFESGALVLDFVNSTTGRSHGRSRWEDSLTDVFATLGWLRQRGAVDEIRFRALMRIAASDQAASDAFMEDARRLRAALERIFHAAIAGTAPREADLARLTAHGRPARPAPARLVWGPQGLARAEPEPSELVLADALAPVVASAEALLTADRLVRIKTCGSSTCEWLFLDTSKNNSRRWCRMDVCGNREKGRRRLQRERAA